MCPQGRVLSCSNPHSMASLGAASSVITFKEEELAVVAVRGEEEEVVVSSLLEETVAGCRKKSQELQDGPQTSQLVVLASLWLGPRVNESPQILTPTCHWFIPVLTH